MSFINIFDHYWNIGGSTTEVYQSKTNSLVAINDPDYLAWVTGNGDAEPTESVETLANRLRNLAAPLPAWLMETSDFIQPDPGVYSKSQLKHYNGNARWRKEQGGMTTTAGFPQKTDDRAQAKITGTYTAQNEVPSVVTLWHDAVGTVHELDAAGMYQLHVDLLTHINDCFSRSGYAVAQIDAGAATNLETIDAIYAADITEARKNWLKKQD